MGSFTELEKKMSFSFRLKSHPNKLLRDHLENVAKLSTDIVNSKYIDNKELFSKVAYLIGISHDFGKATTFFQKMLEKDEKTKYANHAFLSAIFGYYITKNYLSNINKIKDFWYIPVIVWIVINKHHGDLKNIGERNGEISKLEDYSEITDLVKQVKNIIEKNLEEVERIYNDLLKELKFQEFINIFNNQYDIQKFINEIYEDIFKISREEDIKYYFDILFFYSVLLDADKLDASETSIPKRIENLPNDLIKNYILIKFGESKTDIDHVRKEAYKEVTDSIDMLNIKNERILSINLPTGTGKTLSVLSFALNLRERVKNEYGFTPRIIYSLPFLSVIDQNAEIIEDVFKTLPEYKDKEIPSNLFLKHHHLADIEYREEKNNELYLIENLNKSLLLTEGWYSEVVITTFVQFFHSLITNRNRAARKFHNIVNSIIILDEPQSIPPEYWLLINSALTYMSKKFNCWIILMTATKPLIFEEDKEIKNLVKNKEKYFNLLNRYEFNFNLTEKNFEDFEKEIFDVIINEKNKDIMVVLNTIDASKSMYEYIKEKLSTYYNVELKNAIDTDGICNFPDCELINLSTHILPVFRLKRIERIKVKNKRKIIITTQLIEAGVDISVDIIYRDMAPLDCIIQTAGRCNRNNQRLGIVNVVLLKDNKTGRKYCTYIYDSVLIDVTQEIIQNSDHKEAERDFILGAQEKYYNLINERKSKQKSEEVLNHLKRLNFGDIVEFRLIKEEYDSISIFVEINEMAENIRKKIEEILEEKNRFERRENLLKIKNEINKYTLSIKFSRSKKISFLPPIGKLEDFRYIPIKNIKDWYKLDSGFTQPDNIDLFYI
ncbi:MAG: CRISPR-associated endonuclease Cas3'' [Candidatus Aenigmatarchaeota archaeon]